MTRPRDPSATEDDVWFCYRLLLEREPDDAGFQTWRAIVERGDMSLREMVEGFLHSAERRTLEASRLEPELVDLGAFRIWVRRADPQIGLPIARDHDYEPHLARRLRERLRPGSVFVDVGANIGFFTLLAATLVGPAGRVHAFEARHDNLELLRRSLAANRLENVELHHCAVSDQKGELAFFASGSWFSNGRVVADEESGSEQLPRVPALPLDEALAGIERIDVLKMDIEGSEARALAGMRGLLRRHRPVVFTEFSPALLRLTSGVEPQAFLAALAEEHELHLLPVDPAAPSEHLEPSAILARCGDPNLTHLDLMALPRRR